MASGGEPLDIDAAFRRYEVRVRAYGIGWWTRDPTVEPILARNPDLVDRLASRALKGEPIETKDVYFEDNPAEWGSARRKVQDEIVDRLFRDFASAMNPVAIFLLGLPGSGKSSVLKRIAEGYLAELGNGPALTRDADEVRIRLPEYSGGEGSEVVQREVVDVTYGLATHALPRDSHLLIDIVGDPTWLPREVEYFASQGRTIAMLCSEAPIEVAEQRAKERALRDGRYVALDYLRSCAGRPREALERALETSLVRHWAVIDTVGTRPQVREGDGHFGSPGATARYWR